MNLDAVQDVVDAVLYEGYLLYPYRPSSLKNRQRWTFGGIYPRAFGAVQGDACEMRTECLVEGSRETRVELRVGFLQAVQRQPARLAPPVLDWPLAAERAWLPEPALDVGGKHYVAWQEAIERRIEPPPRSLSELIEGESNTRFAFDARRELEPLRDEQGAVAGVLLREHRSLEGAIEWRAVELSDGVFRVSVRIVNTTPMDGAQASSRERASLQALLSCHAILGVAAGAFVSLTDPPPQRREQAAACTKHGYLAGTRRRAGPG